MDFHPWPVTMPTRHRQMCPPAMGSVGFPSFPLLGFRQERDVQLELSACRLCLSRTCPGREGVWGAWHALDAVLAECLVPERQLNIILLYQKG